MADLPFSALGVGDEEQVWITGADATRVHDRRDWLAGSVVLFLPLVLAAAFAVLLLTPPGAHRYLTAAQSVLAAAAKHDLGDSRGSVRWTAIISGVQAHKTAACRHSTGGPSP